MIASRAMKKATMAKTLTGLPFLDDLDRALAGPMVRAFDVHDRDDRGGVVLVDHRLHDLDDPRQRDLPFQEGHDRDLVRSVHDGGEGQPEPADPVGEVHRGERLAVARLEDY